jgi:hypothetical protein
MVAREGGANVDTYDGTTCAVHEMGEVICWGSNTYGEAQPPERLIAVTR